jgi:hypothetical protein
MNMFKKWFVGSWVLGASALSASAGAFLPDESSQQQQQQQQQVQVQPKQVESAPMSKCVMPDPPQVQEKVRPAATPEQSKLPKQAEPKMVPCSG